MPRKCSWFYLITDGTRFRLEFRPGKGIWVAGWISWASIRSNPLYREFRKEWPKMKKRVSKTVMGDSNHLAPMETERFRDMLSLVEHMAVRKYDDGDARETGWVTIKTHGAAWVAQVKDPDGCCSFSAVGETLDKALETAALLLSCDEAPWEPDSFLAQAAARKKRK